MSTCKCLLNCYSCLFICPCTEDKQDDENYVRQRLNEKLAQKMNEIELRRAKEVLEQQRIDKKEALKRQSNQGKKKANLEVQKPGVQKTKAQRKAKDQGRDIHEAYQILLNELERLRLQRRKRARALAIKEKDELPPYSEKLRKSSRRVSIKQ